MGGQGRGGGGVEDCQDCLAALLWEFLTIPPLALNPFNPKFNRCTLSNPFMRNVQVR